MDIGFVGVGHMGNPMAANLITAGHRLTVNDMRREAADNLIEASATWAETPAAAASGAEVVMLSLPKPADVEDVVTGAGGVLASCAKGSIIVDLSTNSPEMVKKLAAIAAEAGVGFVDAPVSGGVVGAARGTLAVMAGGDDEAYARCKPLLDVIGGNVFHVGAVGAGNVAKLVNNMLAFIGMMGTIEALALGAKAGVDPMVLRDIVSAGSGQSFVWDVGTRAILKDRLAPSFTTTLASKDIGLAVDLANEYGVAVPMGERAQALITGYRDNGFADEDVLATAKAVEEIANVTLRGRWQSD